MLVGATTAAAAALLTLAPAALAGAPDAWTHWLPVSGPQDTWIRSLDFTAATTLVASSGDGDGVYQSPSVAGPWSQTNSGLSTPGDRDVYQVVAAYGSLYAATGSGLFKAPQGGGAWAQLGDGTGNNTLDMGGIESVVVESPTSLVVAVAGAAGPGVYTSADGGTTWNRAGGMPIGENVFDLAAGAGPIIYAAGDSGVWTSLDGGASWTLTSDGIDTAGTTFRVAVAPAPASELWAATSNDVYKSTDGGLTWTNVDGISPNALPGAGLKAAFLLAPSLDGEFGPERALVGTYDGVWATVDGGSTWGQMSPDVTGVGGAGVFGQRIVYALGLGFTPPALLAGTQGFGVYSLPLTPVSAPSNLTLSETSGVQPGDTLTVSGAWTGSAPLFYTYEWKRCQGASCSNITSGGSGSSYTVPDSNAGSATTSFEVQVCAINLVSPAYVCATSGKTSGGVADVPTDAPVPLNGVNDTARLSPDPHQSYPWGTTFTINPGDWGTEGDPGAQITPLDYGFQWQRCDGSGDCTVIPDATDDSYTTTVADVGDSIEGFVQASYDLFPSYTSQLYEVDETFTIIEQTPVNTAAPQIVGARYVGTTLQSTAGAWSGHDPTYTREWLECDSSGQDCGPLSPDQTGDTYTLTSADLGNTLELQVTATQLDPSQNRVAVATSAPTAVITNPPSSGGGGGGGSGGGGAGGSGGSGGGAAGGGGGTPKPPAPPKIMLAAPRRLLVGARLSGPPAEAGFKKLSFQWLRDGRPIRHATGRTYKLTKSDLGHAISLRVTLTTSTGATLRATSNMLRIPKPKTKKRRTRT